MCRRVRAAFVRGGHPALAAILCVRHVRLCNLVSTLRLAQRTNIEQLADHLSAFNRNNKNFLSPTVSAMMGRVRRVCLDLCTFPALRCALELNGTEEEAPGGPSPPMATCLFFITGRVIVTGVREPLHMERSLVVARQLAEQFRRS